MKSLSKFSLMFLMMGLFYSLAVIMWLTTKSSFYLLNFLIIGTAIALGAGLWPVLPKKDKQNARKLSQILVGLYMFFGLGLGLIYVVFGVISPENMQIEGFWLWLLSGVFAASVIHYLVAKIIGPLIFNRGWCGWACWTAAVLDLLPWKKSPGRLERKWGYLRYIHFGFSAILIIILLFVFKYGLSTTLGVVAFKKINTFGIKEYSSMWQIPEMWWFLTGNLIYYITGVILAAALKDNRAFCKYLCPVVPLLKLGSQYSLLRVKAQKDLCTKCGLCDRHCPMDIKLTAYIRNGQRITSSECIICQNCINVCPKNALKLAIGFDYNKKEYLNSCHNISHNTRES